MRKLAVWVLLIIMVFMMGCTAIAEISVTGSGDIGVNYIERMGLGFSLEKNVGLKNGDILQSCIASQITLCAGEAVLTANENSLLKVENVSPDGLLLRLEEGELFASIPAGNEVTFIMDEYTFCAEDTVLILTAFTGSKSVSVLHGHVETSDWEADAGFAVTMLESGSVKAPFAASALNDFALVQMKNVPDRMELCFSKEDIDSVVQAREDERQAAIAERQAHDAAILGQGGTVGGNTCTIKIVCDTILDNMQELTKGKNSYVPANGTILSTSKLAFSEGETVFDVLKRACEYAGIQLEYRWTPIYDSYYVEGINHLYEFDCGNESGWMYKVNGWFPNYGCSKYTLKDGDTIVWCYTCKGLGADVGGGM